jgi:hypothetical protein
MTMVARNINTSASIENGEAITKTDGDGIVQHPLEEADNAQYSTKPQAPVVNALGVDVSGDVHGAQGAPVNPDLEGVGYVVEGRKGDEDEDEAPKRKASGDKAVIKRKGK